MNSIRKQPIQYGGEKSLEPLLLDWFWLNSPSHTVDLKAFSDSSLSSLPCTPVSLHPDPSLSLSSLLGLSSVFLLPFPVLLPSDVLRKASPPALCPLSAPTTHKASPVPLVGGGGRMEIKILRLVFLFLNYRDLELLLCWKHLTAGLERDSR